MDLRYTHTAEFVGAQRAKNEWDLNPMPASIYYPGWIDADVHVWAKDLPMPGTCGDIFCHCNEFIQDLF